MPSQRPLCNKRLESPGGNKLTMSSTAQLQQSNPKTCRLHSIVSRLREVSLPICWVPKRHIRSTVSRSGLPSTKETRTYQSILRWAKEIYKEQEHLMRESDGLVQHGEVSGGSDQYVQISWDNIRKQSYTLSVIQWQKTSQGAEAESQEIPFKQKYVNIEGNWIQKLIAQRVKILYPRKH